MTLNPSLYLWLCHFLFCSPDCLDLIVWSRKLVGLFSQELIPKECDSSSLPWTWNEPLHHCWLGISWHHFTLPLLTQTGSLQEFIAGAAANNMKHIRELKCSHNIPALWKQTSVFWIMFNLSTSYILNTGEKKGVDMMWLLAWKWQWT